MVAKNDASEMSDEEMQQLLNRVSNIKCRPKGPNSDELHCDITPEDEDAFKKLGFAPRRLVFNVKTSVTEE